MFWQGKQLETEECIFADVVPPEKGGGGGAESVEWEDYVRKESHCCMTAVIVEMDGRE